MLLVNHKIFIKNIYAFLKGRFGVPVCLFTSKLLSSKWKEGKTTLFRPDEHTTHYTGFNVHRARLTQGSMYVHRAQRTQKKAFWRRLAKVGTCLGKRDVGGGLANNSSTKIMVPKIK